MATLLKRVVGADGQPQWVSTNHQGLPAWLDRKGRPRWFIQVAVGRDPATRKPKTVSRTFQTKDEAERWSRKQESLKDEGLRPATTRQTLAEYLTEWLPLYATQVRTSTAYNLRKVLEKWILYPRDGCPLIGGKQLRKLAADDFHHLYAFMVERGRQPRAIRYVHGALKMALKSAVKNGDLPRNPAEFVTLPKDNPTAEVVSDGDEESGRLEVLDREQTRRFLAAAREEDWHSALWHLLVTTGLRPGEVLGLKWANVDLDQGHVKVRATLTRLGVDGWKLTQPKTKRGRRTVPLPALTIAELRRCKREQNILRLEAGSSWQDHDFVFTTRYGSPLSLSNVARRSFRSVMARAGLGEPRGQAPVKRKGRPGPQAKPPFVPCVRMYALRHTFASLLLADGVPLLVVSRLLGHTSIKLTADVYSHVLPQERDRAAEHMDRMFRIA